MTLLEDLAHGERAVANAKRSAATRKANALEKAWADYHALALRMARKEDVQEGDTPKAIGKLLSAVGKDAAGLRADVANLRRLQVLAPKLDPAIVAVEDALSQPGAALAQRERKRLRDLGDELVVDAHKRVRASRAIGAAVREQAREVMRTVPREVLEDYYAALRELDAAKGRLASFASGALRAGRELAGANVEDLQRTIQDAGEKVAEAWTEITLHVGEDAGFLRGNL